MKRLVFLFVAACLIAGTGLLAADAKEGILIDANCGSGMAADAAKVASHTVACALKCKDGGLGLVADGKFYRFDEQGNTKGVSLLESTSKERALKVKVTGEFGEDSVKVTDIQAVEG